MPFKFRAPRDFPLLEKPPRETDAEDEEGRKKSGEQNEGGKLQFQPPFVAL